MYLQMELFETSRNNSNKRLQLRFISFKVALVRIVTTQIRPKEKSTLLT